VWARWAGALGARRPAHRTQSHWDGRGRIAFRFWVAGEEYQALSTVQSRLFQFFGLRLMTTQRAGGLAGLHGRAQVLADLLREACEAFLESPADEELYHVLDRTSLCPTTKQRVVAEELGLSFSSYRRRLQRAVQRVTERLWGLDREA
jgi:hypothetical protein